MSPGPGRPAIPVGLSCQITRTVRPEHTVAAYGSMDLAVLATPQLILMLEEASAGLIADRLEPGQVSVGVQVSVSHLRAAVPGSDLVVHARVSAVDGPRVCFRVRAVDAAGAVIGAGWHWRHVVDRSRLLAGAARRGRGDR